MLVCVLKKDIFFFAKEKRIEYKSETYFVLMFQKGNEYMLMSVSEGVHDSLK